MFTSIINKIKEFDRRLGIPNWLIPVFVSIFALRIPSFFEPYYYGDEMIYVTLGNAIRHGLTLYKQIHDNKPPLLYYTAAAAGNLFWFKAILAFWMIATTICFWKLTETLFKENKMAQKVAVVIFAILTTIPLFEGNIINAELFLIGPIILAITILLTHPTFKNTFLAGLLFSIAALFKIPAAFDLPVIVVFWFLTLDEISFRNLFNIIKKSFILALGFAIPVLLSIVWYYLNHAAGDYIRAAFLQNLGYISSWGGSTSQSFITKHGPILIRAGIVVIGFIFLRIFHKKFSRAFLVASIWLLTSLFAATLSGRPYPHYIIQTVPAFSILIAILVSSTKKEQVFSIIPIALFCFVPVYYQFYYYSTSAYYIRFAQFASGQITKSQYINKFDSETQNNYLISQKITKMTQVNDRIFVWGSDAPTIYALSRRLPPIKYVADYHITDFSSPAEIAKELSQKPPVLIILLSKSPEYKELQTLLMMKYALISNTNNIEIWHLLHQ